ncbi:MAG: sulfite exporter TauE/SafE family protein, partial [Thermodesulforhabdaceae bacterium]
GASVGAQIGTVATKYIKGYGIRIAFGFAVIGCMISVVLKLLPSYIPGIKDICGTLATVVVLGVVSLLSLYIAVKMIQGARKEIAAKKQKLATEARSV